MFLTKGLDGLCEDGATLAPSFLFPITKNKITMADNLLSAELSNRIGEAILALEPIKVAWDSKDSLSDEQVNRILVYPDGLEQVEKELRSFHADYFRDKQRAAIYGVINEFTVDIAQEWEMSPSEISEELIEGIVERYGLYVLGQVLELDMPLIVQQTHPRVVLQFVLHQFFTGPKWLHTLEYEETRDVLDIFNINPRKIRPDFPDLHWRNGKEYVAADAIRNLWDSGPEAGQYVVALDLDLWHYHQHRDQFHTGIVLHKGAEIWLHDYYFGKGSGASVTLLKDLTILKRNLTYYFGDDNDTIGKGLTEANSHTQINWSGKISPVKTKRAEKYKLRPISRVLRTFRYASRVTASQTSSQIAAYNDFSPLEDGKTPVPGQKMEMDFKAALWRPLPIDGKNYLREQADRNARHMVFRISEVIGQVQILHCYLLVNDETKEVVWKSVYPSGRSSESFEYVAMIISKARESE
jgi:hypothetical protein